MELKFKPLQPRDYYARDEYGNFYSVERFTDGSWGYLFNHEPQQTLLTLEAAKRAANADHRQVAISHEHHSIVHPDGSECPDGCG